MKRLRPQLSVLLLVCSTTVAMAQPNATPSAGGYQPSVATGMSSSSQLTKRPAGCPQSDPVHMLVCISSNLLKTLKRQKETIQQNPSYIYTIVNNELLPYVDKQRLTQTVMGVKAWRRATPQQRNRFTQALVERVVGSYSNAFDAYTDEGIRFYPLGNVGNRSFVTVRSQIVRTQGPPVAVNYSLSRTDGRWQVYDVVVEGVSMTQSFGSQIQGMLSQGNSIDQVITRLEQPVTKQKPRSY